MQTEELFLAAAGFIQGVLFLPLLLLVYPFGRHVVNPLGRRKPPLRQPSAVVGLVFVLFIVLTQMALAVTLIQMGGPADKEAWRALARVWFGGYGAGLFALPIVLSVELWAQKRRRRKRE